jgi:hypothetical protein
MDVALEKIAAGLTGLHNVLDSSFDAQYDEVGVRVVQVDRTYTVFAALPVAVRGGLYVTVRGPTQRFRAGLGAEFTHTGDVLFDQRFHVEAADTLDALPELTIPVRSALLALARVCREVTVMDAHIRASFASDQDVHAGLPALVHAARALRNR